MSTSLTPNEATLTFLHKHWDDDPAALALMASRYPDVNMLWVAQQVRGRQKAKEKLPTWYANKHLVYPPSLSMEQCSSEVAAVYKAELCKGSTLLDVTGGFGVDTAFMSAGFERSVYVERNAELAAIVKHNFYALGLNSIEVQTGDALDFISQPEELDCLYIDPARRKPDAHKAVLLSDCEPDIVALKPRLLSKAKRVIVKLSPLFDITELLRFFPQAESVHVVAVDNECKELLLVLDREQHTPPDIVCVNILKTGSRQLFPFKMEEEQALAFNVVDAPLAYLYEPNAAVQKSGGFKSCAACFGLQLMHPNSRLYTSAKRVDNFVGRKFKVNSIIPFSKQGLKDGLRDIEKANITVRNFPMTVAELRKKLKLQEGGEVYLFATTLSNEQRVLIRCCKDT